MPPRVKITKEDIIKTALKLVRESGEGSINARAIASSLACSTQPIFSNFSTMEEVKEAVIFSAYERYLAFLKNEAESGKYPTYKAFGMAYTRFAKEEKELFKLLFMRDRTTEAASFSPDFEESVKMIMEANGVTEETARRMHLEMWIAVHGIATMLATSFFPMEETLISNILTDIYQGLRKKHTSEDQ